MKSLLNKRTQGFLVAVVVALVAGATGAATATAGVAEATASSGATVSGLTAKQKKAKKKALKKCKKVKKAKKRKACIKKVNKKYKRLAKKGGKGAVKVVEVRDDYYSPSQLSVKVNDSIKWDWKYSTGSEGHNVSLFQGPAGVMPFDFESPIMTGPNATFTRKFTKAGQYHFVCSLHTLMTMDVKVTK